MSNSEAIHLTWRVTLPNQSPINITYDNDHRHADAEIVSSFINTSLVEYISDQYVESILMFKVQDNVSSGNLTLLECIIAELGYDSVFVIIDSSGAC